MNDCEVDELIYVNARQYNAHKEDGDIYDFSLSVFKVGE
jgi:hypothetical protein